MTKLSKRAKAFQSNLTELGYDNEVKQLADSTRTAKEAAEAIGCDVSQIAKSIIFKLKNSEKPLLVIASGNNRINEQTVESYLSDQLTKADADFVSEHTGYVIGGVPPLAHKEPIQTFIDEDLFTYTDIWAAGHPKAVFHLTPDQLVEMTNGKVVKVV